MQVFLVAIVLIGAALVLLGIKIFFTKGGTFPNTHIGGNKNMSDRGIYCANTTDRLDQKQHGVKRLDIRKLDEELNKDQITC